MAKAANAKSAPAASEQPAPQPPEPKPGDVCPVCKGQGKVDDLHKKPWTRLDPEHGVRVRFGQVKPIICPGPCKGTGVVQ